jgi:hypothetical protein
MAKTNGEQAEGATEQTSVKKLKALLRVAEAAYKDSRSIAGGYGEQVARAVEHDHLHKQAFASVVREARMTPEKLAAFYDAQSYYRDVLGLDERAASAPRLPMAEEGEDEGNVRRFPDAAE